MKHWAYIPVVCLLLQISGSHAPAADSIDLSGGQGEQVQEKEGQGLFTAYFLKAIKGEVDLDKDSMVKGTGLGAYLRPTVSNASGQAQTPLFGRLEGEGEFVFLLIPGRK